MRGMTLVEVVTVAAITLLMLGALAELYRAFDSLYGYGRAGNSTTDAAAGIVRATTALAAPADRVLASHAFSTGTYASGASALVLELPSIDSSGGVLSSTYDYAAIYANGTSAYEVMAAAAGSARPSRVVKLGDDIVTLAFAYDNADPTAAAIVTVTVLASTTSRGASASDKLSTSVRLRNH